MKTTVLILLVVFAVWPAHATIWDVNVQSFRFAPANLTIQLGDTVRWTNTGGTHNVHHTGTPTLFHSGNPAGPGAAWPYVFVFSADTCDPGTFNYVCQPHSPDMAGSVTVTPLAADDIISPLPKAIELLQNYPNPFNNETTISFALPQSGDVQLSVLNILGQTVAVLINSPLSAGNHEYKFVAAEIGSGVYFYKLQTAQSTLIRRMVYLQ